jgi:plastocyanin
MTRRLRTCFSLLAACLAAVGSSHRAFCATVSGLVEITQRERSHEALSDVVVWLQASRPGNADSPRPEHVELLQKDKMFHPHVLAVSVGTVVDFPNADPIYHNAFSSYDGQIFDVGLYPPGTSKSIHFRRAGIVRVFCNIHPTMSAVIVVLDTPYFTKVGPDGRYEIANVPPGNYQLRVFDERATAGEDVNLPVTVDASGNAERPPAIHLSELGYVRPSHKNKYGLEYPSWSTDASGYPSRPQ